MRKYTAEINIYEAEGNRVANVIYKETTNELVTRELLVQYGSTSLLIDEVEEFLLLGTFPSNK